MLASLFVHSMHRVLLQIRYKIQQLLCVYTFIPLPLGFQQMLTWLFIRSLSLSSSVALSYIHSDTTLELHAFNHFTIANFLSSPSSWLVLFLLQSFQFQMLDTFADKFYRRAHCRCCHHRRCRCRRQMSFQGKPKNICIYSILSTHFI